MNTLARERCKAEIIQRLNTLRPESTRRWGHMSAHQAVCHMSDAFRMVVGGKSVSDASGRLQRTLVKWTALYAPMRWPPGLSTRPEIDQQSKGTAPGQFEADVTDLIALMERITTMDDGFEWPRHPIFGRLSKRAWLRWAYLHMDHHLRQFGV